MKTMIAMGFVALSLGACTGSRVMYENNGLKLIQVGADPTPINGGFNVLIAERGGNSSVVSVDATGTIIEQVALPGAAIGGAAVLRARRDQHQRQPYGQPHRQPGPDLPATPNNPNPNR